jgi:hypothetical protein
LPGAEAGWLDRITVQYFKRTGFGSSRSKSYSGISTRTVGLVFTDELGRPFNLTTVSHHFDRLLTRYEEIRRHRTAQADAAGRAHPRP